MSENQSFLQELEGRSQKLTLPRRELFQKIASAALLFLVPRPRLVAPLPGYPLPEFAIGDLVAQDWIDEFDKEAVDCGRVLGLRYLPQGHSIFPSNSWLYYIYWTHTTCGLQHHYPCYDGEPTRAEDLRLASHE